MTKCDGNQRKPLIVIPGFFANKFSFKPIFEDHDLLEKRDCYLIDQRNGEYSDWHDQNNYEAFASDVIRWADQNNLKEFDLFGHSMGAKLAQMMAIQYPDRVKNVIAADGAPLPTDG